ncbi:hypothetical protein BSL78_21975 [Apostichopus japonicus]|uniref:CUB domain-containing protein n=1 Tax=Stichopus japonicus TaxID=307972 RepID=A0A2G8JZL6_STIJA|nr:hypothetical protein BSL78_21975 [Apostichopus japonicus]
MANFQRQMDLHLCFSLVTCFILKWVLLLHVGYIDVASGSCDLATCPIVCSGCPALGGDIVTVDPSGPPHPCQEVLIQQAGYPHGYSGQACVWPFDTNNVETSFGVTVFDFDGGDGDMLKIERVLIRPSGARQNKDLFDGDTSDFDALPSSAFRDRGHELTISFTPSQQRYSNRGFSLRIMFAETGEVWP